MDGTITDIPGAGQTIRQGEVLFTVDNKLVILLFRELPAYRNMDGGNEVRSGEGNNILIETIVLEGEDILQLEEALVTLG